MKKILLLYSLITLSAHNHPQNPVKQGVSGRVYLRQGNQMPMMGQPTSQGKPVKRIVLVYEVTKREQVTENGAHYANIKTKLIAQTESDDMGRYSIKLPVGYYSVFVDDNNQLYANSFDGKGNINPIKVKQDSLSKLDIFISGSTAVY